MNHVGSAFHSWYGQQRIQVLTSCCSVHTQVCHVPGATLHIDFPFPAFADNLGNWGEIMLPTYSALSSPSWRELLQVRRLPRLLTLQPEWQFTLAMC